MRFPEAGSNARLFSIFTVKNRADMLRGLTTLKASGFSRSVRLKATPYAKTVRQDGFSN